MSPPGRTHATALALVNWKGVFYERYLLDRHVTALEGANGAGKTTVMIAAYVVLMPDLARLRFTNLGETAAVGGDRGIYGRLGEVGRPSYAAMELELPSGERVVAGVQLVRRSEPTLELKPFLVSGLDLQGSLKEVLLVSADEADEHDAVPELEEVRAAVELRGGTLTVFGSAKDYFGALFQRGVNALRLAVEEERAKLHDMLRTSMTGGISRALTSELRSFLLKEETGLGDTLSRMRANLDACRRTRIEVAEARVLEQEITSAIEAATAMIVSCATGTRRAATLARESWVLAQRTVCTAEDALGALTRALADAESEKSDVLRQAEELRTMLDSMGTRRTRGLAAARIAERLAVAEVELERARAAAAAAEVRGGSVTATREQRRVERDQARVDYERAARGLSDLQTGLEELHRRAHTYRLVHARLEDARRLLGEPALSAATLDATRARVEAELADNDRERAKLAREVALEGVWRAEHEAAASALDEILAAGGQAAGEVVGRYETAQRELVRLSQLEQRAARLRDLEREQSALRMRVEAARGTRQRAAALGLTLDADAELSPRACMERASSAADAELQAAEEEVRSARLAASEAERRVAEARSEAADLEAARAPWSALLPPRSRIEARLGAPVSSVREVTRAREVLASQREQRRSEAVQTEIAQREALREAEALEGGGGLPDDLLALRDELGAELLAARFETTAVDESSWIEAALGPLARALVVADPAAAAETLAQRALAPQSVWLVAEEDVAAVIDAARAHREPGGDPLVLDVVVRERHALRVTRRPEHPILGRDTRARRAAELRETAARLGASLARALEEARQLDALVHDADRLLGDAERLAAGDPRVPLEVVCAREVMAVEEQRAAEARRRSGEAHLSAARDRRDALRSLALDSHHLDDPTLDSRLAEVETACDAAAAARRQLEELATARARLARTIEVLRHVPADAARTTEDRHVALQADRDRLFAAVEALEDVAAHREALAWKDVRGVEDPRGGGDGDTLRRSLESQHAAAHAASDAAEEALRAAEVAWDDAQAVWHRLESARAAGDAIVSRLREELDAAGGAAALGEHLPDLDQALRRAASELEALAVRERALATTQAVARERRTHAERALAGARERFGAAELALAPAESAWRTFAELAEAAGLDLGASQASAVAPAGAPAEHMAEARAQRALLLTRLEHSRGGAEGAGQVRGAFTAGGEAPVAYLEGWRAARDWARSRLPAQFADASAPADALLRLRADLAMLEEKVVRHEADLRGASTDVARGIDLQLRKTAARVRRLNQDLATVAFGSIAAVRIQVRRVERMELVLRALRGAEVQELLFQSDLPFEEALAEVFRRYGGGKGGAPKILDYREYLDLVVEVQRRSGPDWEVASPTRLSTGEAIGVGAALMMVVLTEWERDANLLRSDRATGTLRFLFLDEANRLSPDNLEVLFDLCQTLDLQLLIAAPEVARAKGNTTYRLVRHLDTAGREEVLVSGRRAAPEPAAS